MRALRESADIRSVRRRDEQLENSAREGSVRDRRPVRGPIGRRLRSLDLHDALHLSGQEVQHVERRPIFAIAVEHEALSGGRPRGEPIIRRVVRQAGHVPGARVHEKQVPIAVPVRLEDQCSAGR